MFQSRIITKRETKPVIVLYGESGVGKSTIGTTFPNPIFLDSDDGLRAFDVPSISITSFSDIQTAVNDLKNEEHEFQTVVIDTVDAIEDIITPHVQSEFGISDMSAKWHEGYRKRAEVLNDIIEHIIDLRTYGMNVVFICHSAIVTQNIPELPEYPHRELKLHKVSAAYLAAKADMIGFVSNILMVNSSKKIAEIESRCVQIGYNPTHLSKIRVVGAPETLPPNGMKILELFVKKGEI